jgi:signal transduction histidine kinase
MSIKKKISFVVSLLFSIFLVAGSILLIHLGEEEIRHSIITQQSALVKTLAYGFDQQVSARHKALIYFAAQIPQKLLDHPDQVQTFLQQQIIFPNLFTNILVYDVDGTVLAAYPKPEKYVGTKRLAGMEYITRTVESRKPYISKLFFSPVSQQPVIVMTAPVLNKEGNVIAVLGGSQYILQENLFSGFTKTKIGKTGGMFLITRDRIVIAHQDKTRLMEQIAPGVNTAVEQALNTSSYAGEMRASQNDSMLVTIETMQTTGWLAGAFLPLTEAYEPITAMRNQAIKVIILLLLILLALVWMTTDFLTRPLLLLRNRIQEMAAVPHAENLVNLKRSDEIGELASAFDQLTLVRRRIEEEQRGLTRSLRLLIDCNQMLFHAEDEKKLYRDICQLILKIGGYPFTWVGNVDEAGKIILPVVQSGVSGNYLENQIISWHEGGTSFGFCYKAIQTGTSQIFQEVNRGSTQMSGHPPPGLPVYHSGIALPLKYEGKPFGVLCIYTSEPNAFNSNEIQLLEELSGDLSFGIAALRARAERNRAEVELMRAKESAENATRAKSRFLDIAAHELRTPVTAFSIMLELAQKQVQQGQTLEISLLSRLQGQAYRLSRLVVDLLDVSRLERGMVTLHRTPTDLVSLISSNVEEFSIQAPKRRIVFVKPEYPIEVDVDVVRINQVLSNLLDNAVKYTPEESSVEVKVDSLADRVRVSVIDRGPGISKEQRTELFKPLVRGTSDRVERTSGLGLGLFVCQAIMELHGGKIGVESEEGVGSTFYFELPRSDSMLLKKAG